MIRKQYRVPAINILPEEYRRRLLTQREWLLAAVLPVGLVALVFSLQGLGDGRASNALLRAEERRLTAALRGLAPRVQQAEQLRQEVAKLQANLALARQVRGSIRAPRLDWDRLLYQALVSLPSGLELTSIDGGPGRLVIEVASYEGFDPVERYYRQLTGAPNVAKVTIDKTAVRERGDKTTYLAFTLTLTLTGGPQ